MLVFNRLTQLTLSLVLISMLSATEDKYNLGTKISPNEYKAWNISIFADGKNLPQGSGNYKEGKEIFANKCAYCHGDNGKGGIKLDKYRSPIATLVKSKEDTRLGDTPKKNIGTYWQHSTLLFDYIRRAMPYENPKSLSTNEIYSLTAYLLAENKIISEDMLITEKNLASIKMPNANGFICENYVDTKSLPCMKNCLTPKDKEFNKGVIIDTKDYLKSDCLIEATH